MTVLHNKGFTLVEVIIYLALFSLLMGTAFVTAYQLISDSGRLSVKNTTQEEGNFVMRKINWALTGVETIITPTAGTTPDLEVEKYDGNNITIERIGTKIWMEEDAGPDDFITTENVEVTDLDFEFIPSAGSSPDGIKAIAVITEDGKNFSFTITKYIRK